MNYRVVDTYGLYRENKLIGITTATFSYEFPHEDRPHGNIVQINGAYIIECYRGKGLGKKILSVIERDAKKYFSADYLCCDSSADYFYKGNGYILSSKSRLWKRL